MSDNKLTTSADVDPIIPKIFATIIKKKNKTLTDLTILHAFYHSRKMHDEHYGIVEELELRGYPHVHLDECDSYYNLIKNWKTYNPKNVSNAVLRDDWRIANIWWKNILSKGKKMRSPQFEDYSLERQKQIVKGLIQKIKAEMKRKGWEPKSLSNEEETNEVINLETVLKSLPPVVFVGGNSGYLSGELVTNGNIAKDKNIEIIVVGKPDTKIITALKRIRPEWLADRIRIIFTDKIPIENIIPIFKKGVFKTSGIEQERHEESEESNKKESIMKFKSLRLMNPKEEFSDYNRFYTIWGSKYLDDGIFASKLYNGQQFVLYKEGDNTGIVNRGNQVDMSSLLSNVVEELKRINHDFVIYGEAVCYNCGGKQVKSAELKETSCNEISKQDINFLTLDKISPTQEAGLVFHVHDIIYLDGYSLTKDKYEDRLSKLQEIMSDTYQYVTVVKSSNKITNPRELIKWTNKLRQMKNSKGVSYRANNFTYLSKKVSGNKSDLLTRLRNSKTKELSELTTNLTDCPYYNDVICPLNNEYESLSFPISCSLANIHKCYYLKNEYYEGE